MRPLFTTVVTNNQLEIYKIKSYIHISRDVKWIFYCTYLVYLQFISLFQSVTERMKLNQETPSDAESVVIASCTRREQKDVSFSSSFLLQSCTFLLTRILKAWSCTKVFLRLTFTWFFTIFMAPLLLIDNSANVTIGQNIKLFYDINRGCWANPRKDSKIEDNTNI